MTFATAAALTMACLVGLLLAELTGGKRSAAALKTLAAAGFVAAGALALRPESAHGHLLLAGLVLSALGDVLLIPRARPLAFLLGLLAFLLAHLAYGAAFLRRGVDWTWALAALLPLGLIAAMVLRWLWPHVPAKMRAPVVAYVTAIAGMVALAAGTVAASGSPRILAGAVLFLVSDLAVARERFVQPGLGNRLWGLPCYFVAQLLLASSLAE